jgi:hypothetical protein
MDIDVHVVDDVVRITALPRAAMASVSAA